MKRKACRGADSQLQGRKRRPAAGQHRIGAVLALHCKRAIDARHVVTRSSALTFVAQSGIRGCVHADALSPRQVLLQSAGNAAALGSGDSAVPAGGIADNVFVAEEGDTWPPPSGSLLRLGPWPARRRRP